MNNTVVIRREPSSPLESECNIDLIDGLHWDCISGGAGTRHGFYCLYGYIPYKLAAELVACSGTHNYGYNTAKVCIPESINLQEKYRDAYQSLLNLAPAKPESMISKRRPVGYPPCTKMMIQILRENKAMRRGDLRQHLLDVGYHCSTIRNAISHLEKTNRICVERSDGWVQNQIIRFYS